MLETILFALIQTAAFELPFSMDVRPALVQERESKKIFRDIEADLIQVEPFPKETMRSPRVYAKAYLVGDVATGKILQQKGEHTKLPMASITKLMTAVVAMEHYDLQEVVSIPQHATSVLGAKVNFYTNEQVTVKDLVIASLVRSGNDAALVLAEHAPGGIEEFLRWMNQKAAELRMVDSHFVNPIGFDNKEHYSTCADLFILARYILESHPLLRGAVGLKEYEFTSLTGVHHKVESTNQLLDNSFLNIKGMKTGTTNGAGESFVGLVEGEQGQHVIAILLNSPNRFQEAKTLLWWALDQWEWR